MASARQDSDEAITGINVTPLVDVVLVLLVVLMVAAGYIARQSLSIELPPVSSRPDTAPPRSLDIVVDAAGRVSIDGEPLTDDELRARARALVESSPQGTARATVSADRTSSHGDVVRVLDLLRLSEVRHVGIGVRGPR